MKKVLLIFIVLCVLVGFAGCGSSAATGGAGVAIGAALQHTIAGAKADLQKREEKLIAAYNEGVAIGMKQEDLDQIKQKIRDTQLTRQTVETGETFLNVDWQDPKQTGGAIGLLSSLVLLWLNRRKLKSTTTELAGKTAAINKFGGTHKPALASELHDIVNVEVLKAANDK